jgi:hypothetical protein
MEVRNIVLTNRKHRSCGFHVACPRDAAFAVNRIAVNARARDAKFLPEILLTLDRGPKQVKAIYELHPAPVLLVQPGEVLIGRVELTPSAELGRKRPLIQIIISGVKQFRDRERQTEIPDGSAGGKEQ